MYAHGSSAHVPAPRTPRAVTNSIPSLSAHPRAARPCRVGSGEERGEAWGQVGASEGTEGGRKWWGQIRSDGEKPNPPEPRQASLTGALDD